MQSINTNYQLTFRRMNIGDVPKLKLEAAWMYERFEYYFETDTGPAYIIEEAGRPICAFGALFEWGHKGACEVWFNFIDKKARIFNIVRVFKRILPELAKRYKITRMQAIVRCDSVTNKRFMRFLGFENETPGGMKNKLYNGENAYMFARIF